MDGYRAAATLLVSRDADQDEVRRAFRARAKELHPDTGPSGSESAFVELREAFEQLMATAPAPRRPTVLDRPANRFDARSTADRSNRLDMTDTSRRRVRPAARRGAVDPDERARGLNFSRHLADSLSAMATGPVPHAVAS